MKAIAGIRGIAIFMLLIVIGMPLCEAVLITDITAQSAIVRGSGEIKYGTSQSDLSNTATGTVSIVLDDLTPATTYYYNYSNEAGSFQTLSADTTPPRIDVNLPAMTNKGRIDITGETEYDVTLKLYHDGTLTRSEHSTNGLIEILRVPLKAGKSNLLRLEATDAAGNVNSKDFTISVDLAGPNINLSGIPSLLNDTKLLVKGKVDETANISVLVNGAEMFSSSALNFNVTLDLEEGESNITVMASDAAGNSERVEHKVFVDLSPPDILEVSPLDDSPFYYEGKAVDTVRGKTEPNSRVYMYVSKGSGAEGDIRGSISGGLNVGASSANAPVIEEVIQKAQYKGTSDSEGNFKFEDVDFEHPGMIEGWAPEMTELGSEGLDAAARIAEMQQDERPVKIYIVVVDGVGHRTFEYYTVSIGSCFSDSFDFSIITVPAYQTPNLLSPQRLESGNEMISFVYELKYRGVAENNLDDPRARMDESNRDNNYYNIVNVALQPMCGSSKFSDKDKSYRLACQLMRGRPTIARPINAEQTNWYFRYNLGATSKFLNFKDDSWKELVKNELKFPFEITITYNEKLPGKELKEKTQRICRHVGYFVDIPVDPRKVLPDFLLDEGQKAVNETINTINKVMPILKEVIDYTSIGCITATGLRTVARIYRMFIERFELYRCKITAKLAGDKCPVTLQQLQGCFYIIGESESSPYPSGVTAPDGLKCNEIKGNTDSVKKNIKENQDVYKYFSSTVSAWNMESTLYTAYRWICDRVWCHRAPAGWTQGKSVAEITKQKYEEMECADHVSVTRTLLKRENCYKELEKSIDPALQSKVVIALKDLNDVCYQLGPAIYMVDKGQSAGKSYAVLERIDRNKQNIPSTNNQFDSTPNNIIAFDSGGQYYTANYKRCSALCGNKKAVCADPEKDKQTVKGLFRQGPTVDCWASSNTEPIGTDIKDVSLDQLKNNVKKECFCEDIGKDIKDEKTNIENKGAKFAGTETGAGKTESNGEWPWNYREWVLYRETKQKAGIYYPSERYYSGRDRSAAFGANYLLDMLFGKEEVTTVDPFTQDIGAFQTACLTGIYARLNALRNILIGFMNCLKQVQTTGRADAGVCKEIFSQYVCNMAYKIFTYVSRGCNPIGSWELGEEEEESILETLKITTSSIEDGMQSMVDEVQEEYGNAKINQYLEGGSEALMKKICLAAFGIDVGFDITDLVDASYSVPFKTSVMVFSSEGSRGRREFLSFNPQTRNPIYEYRAAWTIIPGCDIEHYDIQLSAVSQHEAMKYKNINCAAVGNMEAGSRGCDNWNGAIERLHSFDSGSDVKQGIYVDKNKAFNFDDSPYRYDHIKVTVYPDPKWPADKCIPKENLEGSAGVFYFPIFDATAKDLLHCNVQPDAGGIFVCSAGDLEGLGNAWITSVECYDEDTASFKRCDRMVYAIDDEIKVKVNVFNSGKKVCLKTYAFTYSGEFVKQDYFWDIVGFGQPMTVPVEVSLDKITGDQYHKGMGGRVTQSRNLNSDVVCSIGLTGENEVSQKAETGFVRFEPQTNGKIKVAVSNTIKAKSGFEVKQVGADYFVTKNNINDLEKSEVPGIRYTLGGYGITVTVPDLNNLNKAVTCSLIAHDPTARALDEQKWKIVAELYYPDEMNECKEGVPKMQTAAGSGFKTQMTSDIRVRLKKTSTQREEAFNKGKRLLNEADKNSDSTDKYIEAYNAFFDAVRAPPVKGDITEVTSYYYAAMAFTIVWHKIDASRKDKFKQDVIGTIKAFEARQAEWSDDLKKTDEFLKAKEYLNKVKEKLS